MVEPTPDPTLDAKYNVNKIFIPGFTDRAGGRGVSVAEAKNFFKNLRETNPVAYNALKTGAAARGIPTDHKSLLKIMNAAVDWTQTINNPLRNSSPTGIDPAAYLDYYNAGSVDLGGGSKRVYGTQQVVDERVTQYSKSGAAADIQKMARGEMGQELMGNQVSAYTAAVNAAAKKEPAIYKGTTTTKAPSKGLALGSTISKGTQTTGFDATEFAKNFVRRQEGYAENFAASTFLKLVQGAITDPNRIGEVVQ